MLNGVRVIEVSTDVAGAFAGRLLAAYGADVIVLEPPEGHPIRRLPPWPNEHRDPEDSVLFAYLGAGKRSAVVDLHTAAGVEQARRLIDSAEVVIESYAPGRLAALGLDLRELMAARPALTVVSITPYGQDGPRSHWRATALTAFASGGQMASCGDPDEPPLKTAGHQAHYQAGLHAFAAAVTALYASRTSGAGDHVDISIQEVQVATTEGQLPNALVRGTESSRAAGNGTFAQWGIQPCADGYIGVAAMPRQSFAIYDAIGHPELKDDPAFASGWSLPADAVLRVLIPEWTLEHTAADIFEVASKFRAPFARILTPRELLEWPHLREVGFWHEVDHPRLGRHPLPAGPIEFDGRDRGKHRRAPLIGEHTAQVLREAGEAHRTAPHPAQEPPPARPLPLPLEGIRVVDVTQVWAGPYASRLLADMGAEVVKVEGPTFPDPLRTMSGATAPPEINQSAYFNEYNRNKLGLSLDLKDPEGMAALKRMIADADVFMENWSSGVADRIGLGYEDLRAINPDLVYLSMPGFGHRGSDAARVGFGPTIEQMGGLVALQGYEGGPPHRSGISYGDPIAGTAAAAAVAIALLRRLRTGEPAYIVIPQRDGIIGLIGEYILGEALGCPLPARIGNRDPYFAPQNVYPARDGEPRPVLDFLSGLSLGDLTDRWLAVSIDSDEAWDALRLAIGDARLDDPRYATMDGRRAHQPAIDEVIAAWSAARVAEESAEVLQAAGVAAAPVLTPLLLTRDAHLEARDNWLWYEHPDAGRHRMTRPAWRLARRPVTRAKAAPCFGEDSEQVLQRLAGCSPEEITAMQTRGVTSRELRLG